VSASPLDPQGPHPFDDDSAVLERIGALLPRLLASEVRSHTRRARVMGLAWEHAHAALCADPTAFRRARSDAELEALVRPAVREALGTSDADQSALGTRSGALDTFVDAQLRSMADVGSEASPDVDAPLDANPLVADALAHARECENPTLERNLRWMVRRDEGYSYDAIAAEARSPAASVRTGVRRARQAIRRIAQEKRRAANAPHQGECPPELAAARDAWKRGDLESLRRELEAADDALEQHPYWLFLSALLADDSGDRDRAVQVFESVLLRHDDSRLRAKVLNCLGYIADDRADRGEAHRYWSRSVQVDPHHTPAHVNLLKSACDRRDKLDVHVCIDMIGDLLSSRALARADKEYLVTRLAEHPDFEWARSFDAWRKGPARWIARMRRSTHASGKPGRRAGGALAVLALVGLGVGLSTPHAAPSTPEASAAQRTAPAACDLPAAPQLAGSGDRGGYAPEEQRQLAHA